jgi:hypothetical protein
MPQPVGNAKRSKLSPREVENAYRNAEHLALAIEHAEAVASGPRFDELPADERRARIAAAFGELLRAYVEGHAYFGREELHRAAELLYPLGHGPEVDGRPYPCLAEGLSRAVERALWLANPARSLSLAETVRREPIAPPNGGTWADLLERLRGIVTPKLRCDLGIEGRRLAALVRKAEAGAKPKPPEDDPDYQPAAAFERSMLARLRQASRKGRRSMRIRSTKVDGVRMYSRADAKRWWPKDFEKREKA